jgi:hypothetical protein
MRISPSFVLAASFGVVLAGIPVLGHHSFSAQYDRNKPITITGPVTKVEWINPHARFFMDAKDSSGKIVNWEVELASPNGLMRRGWSRTSLKIGVPVTMTGSMAKDGSNVVNASTVTLGDGKKVFAGSSSEDEPQ